MPREGCAVQFPCFAPQPLSQTTERHGSRVARQNPMPLRCPYGATWVAPELFGTYHKPSACKRPLHILHGARRVLSICERYWRGDLHKAGGLAQFQCQIGILPVHPFVRETTDGCKYITANDE